MTDRNDAKRHLAAAMVDPVAGQFDTVSKSAKQAEPKPKLKRKRDSEATSATILKAATYEFMDKGYGGARVDEIASRAGINKRMLYHYYGNKDALYIAVLESVYRSIRSAENRLHLDEMSPREGMKALAHFTWSYFNEHPEFIRILITENVNQAKFLKKSKDILAMHSPLINMISQLLEKGRLSGEFRRDADPVALYVTIASLGFFYLSNRYTLSTIFGKDMETKQSLAKWGDHIVEVVLSYLRP